MGVIITVKEDDLVVRVLDVSVFQIKTGQFVVRQFGSCGCQMGDDCYDEEPTDDELRTKYGADIGIRRGYDIVGADFMRMLDQNEKREAFYDSLARAVIEGV